jgi:hypothetical protein
VLAKDSAAPPATADRFDEGLILARALGRLVTVLREEAAPEAAVAQRERVRRALRFAVAAARRAPLELRLADGLLQLSGRTMTPDSPLRDELLDTLVDGLSAHGSLVLDVRRAASPGELLALAQLLATDPGSQADRSPWRSWSVRITPESVPAVSDSAAMPDAVADVLTRLRGARSGATVQAVLAEMQQLLATPPWQGDPVVVEGLALGLVQEARRRGSRAGRLTLERGVRQLLSPTVVQVLVRQLPRSRRREDLMPVLARAGDLAVHALVQLLQEAETLADRRACFDAIVALDAGEEALREALEDPRWYVVRNAAALLGEMGVVEADVHLIPLLTHDDERLRIAGARALTRLGTPKAIGALQGCLEDPAAELRRLAASAHGARSQGKPSTIALLAALDAEVDEDVVLEILSVLGTLGSPECVQRLVRIMRDEAAAEWLREAAYQGLLAARGDAVQKLLEG